MKKKLRAFALVIGLVVIAAAAFVVARIGPRNVIGMLRYDQRQEGDLKVGDRAPDVVLLAPDGVTQVHLRDHIGRKPFVLLFGSYT
jgi:hypothetical protein